MLRGLFITGTDTNVGKTVVAAAVMHRYRRSIHLTYWKPIQTGTESDDDTATVQRLANCRPGELLMEGIRLPQPVSPHLAARRAGKRISIDEVGKIIASKPGETDTRRWIIEGAGGVMVPLNETEMMADLMVHFHVPVVLVARSSLGTINHTLLTLEALRTRGLEIAGVVMMGEPNHSNRDAIEEFGATTVLGEMPVLSELTAETLGQWAMSKLDTENHLLKYLQ